MAIHLIMNWLSQVEVIGSQRILIAVDFLTEQDNVKVNNLPIHQNSHLAKIVANSHYYSHNLQFMIIQYLEALFRDPSPWPSHTPKENASLCEMVYVLGGPLIIPTMLTTPIISKTI